MEVPVEEALPTYVIQAVGYYKNTSAWTNIITFVTKHKTVSVVALAAVLFMIIAIVFLVMSRKKKKVVVMEGGVDGE